MAAHYVPLKSPRSVNDRKKQRTEFRPEHPLKKTTGRRIRTPRRQINRSLSEAISGRVIWGPVPLKRVGQVRRRWSQVGLSASIRRMRARCVESRLVGSLSQSEGSAARSLCHAAAVGMCARSLLDPFASFSLLVYPGGPGRPSVTAQRTWATAVGVRWSTHTHTHTCSWIRRPLPEENSTFRTFLYHSVHPCFDTALLLPTPGN